MSQATEQIARQFANANINKKNWNVQVNVKVYGAVGDGVTDDTQAFRDALAFLNTAQTPRVKTLYVPSGDYKITDQIDITLHKVSIIGEENAQTTIVFDPANLTLNCFHGDGTGYAPTLNNIWIKNIVFNSTKTHTGGAYIHLKRSSQCIVDNCRFLGGNKNAIWVEESIQTEVKDSFIQNCKTGILFESSDVANQNIDAIIHHNYVRDCSVVGISFTNYCNGIFVHHNILYHNDSNMGLVAAAYGQMFSVQILNNDFDGANNKGLEMVRVGNFQVNSNWVSSNQLYSIVMDLCSSGTISDNLIYPTDTAGDTNFAVYLQGCSTIGVNGNTIGGGDGGVRIDKTNLVATTACRGITLTGNTMSNMPLGIHLYNNAPASKGVTIVGNTFDTVTTPVGDSITANLVNVNNNSFT